MTYLDMLDVGCPDCGATYTIRDERPHECAAQPPVPEDRAEAAFRQVYGPEAALLAAWQAEGR